jgi:hypothetical protein
MAKDCNACFERGTGYIDTVWHGRACQNYARQRVWNKKMQTLLGREPEEAPIPKAPTYTWPELERWSVGQAATPVGSYTWTSKPNIWWRETWALLQTDGKAYKQFIKACEKGAPSESL